MSIQKLLLLLVLVLSSGFADAQSREMGLMVGLTDYKGDLEPNMYDSKSNHLMLGIVYRRCYNNHWSFKGGINYGHIEANDSEADDEFSRNRNLNFKSYILEGTAQMEFNFLPYQAANPHTRFSPYLLGGLSIFRFNPKGYFEDDWITLQTLGTEGQGLEQYPDMKAYKRTSFALTIGGGFKFTIKRRFGLTIETGARRTYTDYLDDVSGTYADPDYIRKEYGRTAAALSDRSLQSAPGGNVGRQRGDSSSKDWYVFTGIQITYTLSKKYIDNCTPFRIKN